MRDFAFVRVVGLGVGVGLEDQIARDALCRKLLCGVVCLVEIGLVE